MKDNISVTRLSTLHPDKRKNFQNFIEDCENTLGITIRITQALRTFSEQDALYAQGRTTKGAIVTAAKGGQSWHCFGLAIDIVPIINGAIDWNYDYSKLNAIGVKYGLTWGHPWKDNDHFEDNIGKGPSGWHYALDLWNKGSKTNGYVNL